MGLIELEFWIDKANRSVFKRLIKLIGKNGINKKR
jgi:hypothetical protein